MSLKSTEKLCVMIMKNDAKFEEELTIDLPFQNWHEGFDEFWTEHWKVSKIFILMCSFWEKDILFELKKYRGVIFRETEKGYKIWRGINLSFKNWHKEFVKFWPECLKASTIFTLMGSFWGKYILFELKKLQRSNPSWKWRGIQNLGRYLHIISKLAYKEFDKIWPEHTKV